MTTKLELLMSKLTALNFIESASNRDVVTKRDAYFTADAEYKNVCEQIDAVKYEIDAEIWKATRGAEFEKTYEKAAQ